jgi:hypothetical protein
MMIEYMRQEAKVFSIVAIANIFPDVGPMALLTAPLYVSVFVISHKRPIKMKLVVPKLQRRSKQKWRG